MDPIDDLLAEQKAYYHARAPEYDDWWNRSDRYRFDPEFEQSWWSEVAVVDTWFETLGDLGDTLELAAGTGIWTARVVRQARHVTAVDASPATLDINRERLAGHRPVEYVVADIFDWEPAKRYDTVFFGFWLSHVPRARFDAFWRLVDRCLRPEGRAAFVDNAHPALAADGPSRPPPDVLAERGLTFETGREDISTRTLADGRAFDIVKVWWQPADLERRLAQIGWSASVSTTQWAFLYGECRRRSPQAS